MEWTTGALKFAKIKQHFQGIHKDTGNGALVVVGNSRSNDAFSDARDAFLAQTFEETRDYNSSKDDPGAFLVLSASKLFFTR